MIEFLLPIMMAFGTGMQAGGQAAAGKQAAAMGKARQQEANYEADQLDQNAGQAIAASQRSAQEERRQARYAASRALAVSAASGAGASDTTIHNIIASITAEGAYRAAVALYEGEDRARALREQAKATRYTGEVDRAAGKAEQSAANIKAVSTVIAGGASLYQKYGMTGGQTGGYTPTAARAGSFSH